MLIVSVGLGVKAWYDAKNKKAQVKIWMQDANGLQVSLARIIQDNLGGRYSSTNDMANAIWSLQSIAFSLYQSLYEERCLDEKEFIKEQQALRKELNENDRKSRKNQFIVTKAKKLSSLPIPPDSNSGFEK